MTMRRATFLVLGGVILQGCGEGSTGPGNARYFPLALHATWAYEPEDPIYGDPVQWRVSDRRGDTVTLARSSGPSHPGPVTLLERDDRIDLLLPDEGAVPFYRFVPGTSWIHRDPWECDESSTWVAVEQSDPVSTPAGTFQRTLRLERRSETPCADAGTMIEWWAAGVGLVRWEELNFYAGGPITYDLVGYVVE